MSDRKPQIHGVDLDGTLAHFDGWKGPAHIGPPIPAMLARVKAWIAAGDTVYICTARMAGPSKEYPDSHPAIVRRAVDKWCEEHVGQALHLTASKGHFHYLWDDSVHQVIRNTGETLKERVLRRLGEVKYAQLGEDNLHVAHLMDFLIAEFEQL